MRRPASSGCQVEGCQANLAGLRSYFQRQKICEDHAKADAIPDGRGGWWRFCQQCTKLECLEQFDGSKRSCRASLLKRHERHRLLRGRKRPHDHSQGSSESGVGSPDSGSSVQPGGSGSAKRAQSGAGRLGVGRRAAQPAPSGAAAPGLAQLWQAGGSSPPVPGLPPPLPQANGAGDMDTLHALLGSVGAGLAGPSARTPTPGSLPGFHLPSALAGTAAAADVPGGSEAAQQQQIEALVQTLCDDSLQAAAAAASAVAAAQVLLQVPGCRAWADGELCQLLLGLQQRQRLQAQMLQQLADAVQLRLTLAALDPSLQPSQRQLLQAHAQPGPGQDGPLAQALLGQLAAQQAQHSRRSPSQPQQPAPSSAAELLALLGGQQASQPAGWATSELSLLAALLQQPAQPQAQPRQQASDQPHDGSTALGRLLQQAMQQLSGVQQEARGQAPTGLLSIGQQGPTTGPLSAAPADASAPAPAPALLSQLLAAAVAAQAEPISAPPAARSPPSSPPERQPPQPPAELRQEPGQPSLQGMATISSTPAAATAAAPPHVQACEAGVSKGPAEQQDAAPPPAAEPPQEGQGAAVPPPAAASQPKEERQA